MDVQRREMKGSIKASGEIIPCFLLWDLAQGQGRMESAQRSRLLTIENDHDKATEI